MPWQNVFSTVFQAGNTVVINTGGLFIYKGPPAAGYLLFSVVPPTRGINPPPLYDPYGNYTPYGLTVYSASGPTAVNYFMSVGWFGLQLESCPSGQGPANAWTPYAFLVNTDGSTTTPWQMKPGQITLQEGALQVDVNGAGWDTLFADANGRPSWFTGNNNIPFNVWTLDRSQTDNSTITLNNPLTTPQPITKLYNLDPVDGMTPGTVYTITTQFTGTWGAQHMWFYALYTGGSNNLVALNVPPVTGAVAGDIFSGWVEFEATVAANGTSINVQIRGAFQDTAMTGGYVGPTNSLAFASGINNRNFTGGTLGIGVLFTASATQSITTVGSRITRRG